MRRNLIMKKIDPNKIKILREKLADIRRKMANGSYTYRSIKIIPEGRLDSVYWEGIKMLDES